MQAPIVYADGSTSQQVFDASYNRLTGSLPPFLASSTVASFIKSEIFLQVGCRDMLWCLLYGTDAMQSCYLMVVVTCRGPPWHVILIPLPLVKGLQVAQWRPAYPFHQPAAAAWLHLLAS